MNGDYTGKMEREGRETEAGVKIMSCTGVASPPAPHLECDAAVGRQGRLEVGGLDACSLEGRLVVAAPPDATPSHNEQAKWEV
jgi:hypothetical protein